MSTKKNSSVQVKIREKCLAICIDIRNSTKFHINNGLEKSSKIVAEFIENCYIEMMKKNGLFDNFIYAGDGIVGVCLADNNAKAFDRLFEVSLKIKEIILRYEKYFKAGIGLDYGRTIELPVKNVKRKYNNTLYTGDSVSTASKFCKLMPFSYVTANEKIIEKYIAISKDFHKNLSSENQQKCRETKKKTKYVER